MIDEHHPATVHIARFGLPLVILIFYVTASLNFEYTPDSTYSALQLVNVMGEPGFGGASSTTSSPLWMLLVVIGRVVHVDILVTAKVFSLFFCSFIILFSFLLANEVLRDRLLSFCVALVVAVQWWLLQAGPSGSAIGFGVFLSLVSVFFLLRNEYLLSALFVGLSTLVFWQAVGLFALLMTDIALNSVDRRLAGKMMGGVVLVYCCVVLPWVLYAASHRLSIVTMLVPLDGYSGFSLVGVSSLLFLGALTIGAVLVIPRTSDEGKTVIRTQVAPLAWTLIVLVSGFFVNHELIFMGVPLLIVYGFLGLREILVWARWEPMAYTAALVFTGVLIIQNQVTFGSVRAELQRTIDENKELASIAIWLKANTPAETRIVADKPGIVGYYSDLSVLLPEKNARAPFVVSDATKLDGYEQVFKPIGEGLGDIPVNGYRYSVWKRK